MAPAAAVVPMHGGARRERGECVPGSHLRTIKHPLARTRRTFLGLVAGYFGGRADSLIMRLMDMLLAFPAILLAIFITAVLGPN